MSVSDSLYLNLGCGRRFHSGWVNIDLSSPGPEVVQHDLRQGIPFPDQSCDAIYHSHLLEHIPQEEVLAFLKECQRVLKSRGVLRVVVPDLETICRLYLEKLHGALAGDPMAAADCEWMRIELLDQMARDTSGGRMGRELQRTDLPNRVFVLQRIGGAGAGGCEAAPPAPRVSAAPPIPGSQRGWMVRLGHWLRRASVRLALNQTQRQALLIGSFRNSGEVHRWMYDRYSLARLLEDAGFVSPQTRRADESMILGWLTFHLDSDEVGKPIKPDSLFMEAVKP